MTFIVPGDRRFVIIPKHSDLPLGPLHHRKEKGTVIQQQGAYKNNPAQQVELRQTGTGEHFVYLPYDGLFWAIAGESRNAGAELIQWLMQDQDGGARNQRFRFLYAGAGYYYLRSVHSGLVLEVPGATRGQDTIKQGPLVPAANRNHQLFRVVPASPEYMANDVRSFQKYSDMMRDVLLGVTGLIPEVGGGIKAVLGVIWPDNHDQDFWNQMTQYVEQRVKALLREENMHTLRAHLHRIRKQTKEFLETTQLPSKSQKLTTAISDAASEEYDFLRDHEGATVLPLLAAWGTLTLALRAEKVKGYAALYPELSAAGKEAGRKEELVFLQQDIDAYVEGVKRAQERAMLWRLGHIRQDSHAYTRDTDVGSSTVTEFFRNDWVTDNYDGWRVERTKYSTSQGQASGDPNSEANITSARLAREARVRAQFNAELDAMLAPAYLWPYLNTDKTERPTDQQVPTAVGPFGGRAGGQTFAKGTGGLKKIVICSGVGHHPYVCGLKLAYADGVEHTYGTAGSHHVALDLAAGEYITNVRGYEWDLIVALLVETNHGRLIEGGQMGSGTYFEGGLDDTLEAKLVGIAGSYENDRLNTLTFHWEYSLKK